MSKIELFGWVAKLAFECRCGQPAVALLGRTEPTWTAPCCDRRYRIKAWGKHGPEVEALARQPVGDVGVGR